MPNATKLLLIHGAWHGSWVWDRLCAEMPDVGTVAIDLPSSGNPECVLEDDVAVVRAALDAQDVPVVVVAHSFGGLVASQALGDLPMVQRIVFIAALMPAEGETMEDEGGQPVLPPFWLVREDGVSVREPRDVLFHDVAEVDASAAIARLLPHSLEALRAVPTKAAWRTIPSTYVVCEDDRCLPPSVQELIARRAGRVQRLRGGHSPMLARPAELASILRYELES